MSVLVFGKSGQVAHALSKHEGVICYGRADADFTDPGQCVALLQSNTPSLIINAAAYTAVDQAEDEEDLATQINATTPGLIAAYAAANNIPFVHLSTDYVFDGRGDQPFAPDHPLNPLGAYGRTKALGEQQIARAGGAYAIVRTSWVFSATGSNFVKTMLRLAEIRDSLTIVGDQIGGPTAATSIAAMTLKVGAELSKDPDLTGTYHFAGDPVVSWADFARAIFSAADLPVEVTDIPSTDYPTRAVRPHNSRLDGTSLKTHFDIEPADWRHDLADVIDDLKADTA